MYISKSHQDIIISIVGEFSVLNERQRFLLCFMALYGSTISSYQLNEFRKIAKKRLGETGYSERTCNRDIDALRKNGFVGGMSYGYYVSSTHILPNCHIKALYFLLTEHRNWLKWFDNADYSMTNDVMFIRQVIEAQINKKDYKTPQYYSYHLFDFMWGNYSFIFEDKAYRELAYLIPPTYIPDFIELSISRMQERDYADYLPFLEGLAEQAQLSKLGEAHINEMFACAHYFYDGTYKEIDAPVSYYGYILKGVRLANETNYDAAVEVFEKGFKLYNKMYRIKNIYYLMFAGYYSTICYARCSNEKMRSKVATMYKKYDQQSDATLEPAHLIATYYADPKELNKEYFRPMASIFSDINANIRNLYLLIMDYLDIKTDIKFTDRGRINHKIVAHEMRSMLKLSDKEIAELNNLYGDTPVLTAERHLEEWELTLNSVLNEDAATEQKTATSRITYILRDDSYVEFREQTRLKNGEWGVGKAISIKRFSEIDDSALEEADKQVRNISTHSYSYWDNPITIILPMLIGCDRVFIEEGRKYLPVTVDEEKPFLMLDKTKDGYKFTSNLNFSLLLENHGNLQISKKSKTHYTVIRYTPRQHKSYKSLLGIKKMPLKAEDKLREFMTKIDSTLGVHSTAIEGAETLNAIEGNPEIVIRVYPARGLTFNIDISARAVKGGKETFAPGKGSAIIMDEVDGERCQVKRKLSKEKSLFDNIRQVIEDITSRSFEAVELTGSEMLELIEYVREQEGYCLEWPKGEQIKLSIAQEKDWSIKMKKTGRWFEVEGNVQVNMDTMMSMSELLEAIANSSGKYVKLGEGDYMLISDTLRRQLERLNALSVNDRGKIKISPLQAAVGDDIFNGDSAIQVDEAWVKLRNKIIDSYGLKPRVPSTLKADLRDYQLEGYKWMKRLTDWGGGACLADDMGLGKTVQAIAYLLSEAKKGAALVVAPASVLPNWRNELERFAPTLNVKILNSSTDRAGDVSTAGPGDVVVTTYGLLVSEENMLVDKKWHTVCLDEAHAIKNRDTKMSKVAMQLDAKNRIAMTGTPIQNHLGELWNLFQFLNPGLLGTHEQFHKKFIVPIENEDNHGMQRHLKKIIAPFMLRRTKSEVVDELPDKTEIKISVDLTDEETAVYETIRVRAEQQLQEQNRVDVNVLAQITQLRRAACTPKLVNDSFKGESSKLDAFVSLVDEIASGGNKVLVFSQFTSFLQLAKEQLDKAGIKYLYFDGSTTIAKREKIIEQFRSGEVQLFLISLKAGGLGLNLTEANYVIHLDPWWNPAIEQQATDRAYRIGQKQKVTVYHLISAHTIEEKILRLHAVKRDLADQLLEGTNISHKLTAKDLLEMLSTAE